MKKLLALTTLAFAALSANAVEVGLTTTADYSGASKQTGYGVTVGKQSGALSLTAGFDRFSQTERQDRYSLVAGYDVLTLAKLRGLTVTPKLGVAYLDNSAAANGTAMTLGVGATLPVTKQVDFTVDWARQYGQARVQNSDGNSITAGLKYKF